MNDRCPTCNRKLTRFYKGNESKLKHILDLREKGLSLRQIAKEVGMDHVNVNKILKKYREGVYKLSQGKKECE